MSGACYHLKFNLFVTGRAEEKYLPKLFGTLASPGICSFVVREFIGQRRPRTSGKRRAEMVRTGQKIPDKDFEQIGGPARRYLQADTCSRVILIDDLEESGRDSAKEIFQRYRDALDTALGTDKHKASVHFLVNMLEAYFFADPDALNQTLNLNPPVGPPDGDVELIPHPKGQLKQLFPPYRETQHPEQILDLLNLDIVLADPTRCVSLRTCIKWIVDQCRTYPDQEYLESCNFAARFHLDTGRLSTVTANQ